MPANLSPPIDLTGIIGDLGVTWRQHRYPVFNSLGRQIGSYETLADFCAGRWIPFAGEVRPPNSELRIRGFPLGLVQVPAAQACLDRQQATTIATPAQVAAQKAKVDKQGRAIIPGTTITLPQLPAVPTLGQIPYSQLALWGGAGLLAILLLRQRA